jgi:hypothetical protein
VIGVIGGMYHYLPETFVEGFCDAVVTGITGGGTYPGGSRRK